MADFSINEMLDMQKKLQDKYKDKWETLSPEVCPYYVKFKILYILAHIITKYNYKIYVCSTTL